MIQILRPRSFGAEFGRAIGTGLGEGVSAGLEEKAERKRAQAFKEQQEMQQQQENQRVQQLTGMDISGIRDPKMRQEVMAQALQGQRAQELEGFKQESKGQREQEKQNFLNKLFGSEGQQEPLEMGQESQMGGMGGFDPSQLSDADLARVSALDPNLARTLMHAKDVALREKSVKESREFEKHKLQRKEAGAVTTPILQEMNEARKNIPLQEQAILDIQEAAPNVSAQDYLAEVTGFEPFRTEHGAKLKTAIKDFFLSDLSRAGARPNMWIEQQLADALPKIGRSKEANLITAEGMKFKVDLAKKRIEEIDRLSEEDRDKYGYVKPDIDSRASKNMKKYVIDRQAELKKSIENIKAKNEGKTEFVRMTSPDGKTYDIHSDDVDEALKNDYIIAK